MALVPIRVQHSWLREDGLPENAVVNVFHFQWDNAGAHPASPGMADAVKTMLDNFYANFDEHYASYMTGAATMKFYSLLDPEPRVPFTTRTGAAKSVSGSRLPGEVALCLSFQAPPVSGEPQARKRGRVFLGPFGTGALLSVTSGTRPAAALVTDMLDAASELITASDAQDCRWAVYSQVGNTMAIVSDAWVDNAFDTMRSRGIAPSTKTHI